MRARHADRPCMPRPHPVRLHRLTGAIVLPRAWLDLCDAHLAPGVVRSKVEWIEARLNSMHGDVQVMPPRALRYRALELVSPQACKVVLVGQDPYHNVAKHGHDGVVPQATGLSFSVPDGVRPPPSLINIFKEMASDLGVDVPAHGNLEPWAHQGVLLLNTILSVELGRPKSHAWLGWQDVTAGLIESLSASRSGLVFILWGRQAQLLKSHIRGDGHEVIESSHPSPIGGSCHRGFFGSRPFSRANAALERFGVTGVEWHL